MSDKKGLSTVVTTLIIILLVLVAIGIVWVVVRGLISTTEGQINIQQKCIGVTLDITSASCTGTDNVPPCDILVRKLGTATPDGMQVTIYTLAGSINNKNVSVGELNTNVNLGATGDGIITKVSAAAYFGNGADRAFCTQVVESTNIA